MSHVTRLQSNISKFGRLVLTGLYDSKMSLLWLACNFLCDYDAGQKTNQRTRVTPVYGMQGSIIYKVRYAISPLSVEHCDKF
jgi:hypothetical protein